MAQAPQLEGLARSLAGVIRLDVVPNFTSYLISCRGAEACQKSESRRRTMKNVHFALFAEGCKKSARVSPVTFLHGTRPKKGERRRREARQAVSTRLSRRRELRMQMLNAGRTRTRHTYAHAVPSTWYGFIAYTVRGVSMFSVPYLVA